MSLNDFFERFPTEASARAFVERERWGDNIACPHCGDMNVYRIKGSMPFKCGGCKDRFSVRTGTPMEESRIPVRKWLLAMYIMTTARKGISSIQFAKELGVTQKTAWFLEHRIREACAASGGWLSGEVEADEAYFGGKAKNMHARDRDRRVSGRGGVDKAPVLALVERGGPVRAFAVPDTTKGTLQGLLERHVEPGSTIYTDESTSYTGMDRYRHVAVRHSAGQYVNGRASTNGAESFWALMKRAYIGTHHWWSVKHLFRYVTEYEYRQNTRGISGLTAIGSLIRNSEGSRLTYADLTAE